MDKTIRIYPTITTKHTILIDTMKNCGLYLPGIKTNEDVHFTLSSHSLDVDFLTNPLKFRFLEKSVPPQLNTNLNGAVYLGYRTDNYKIQYQTTPLQIDERRSIHFGYSLGIFTGLGNTFMSPTNTQNALQQEYDGIVWSKGVAAIIGLNNFTAGLTIGFDNLLDKNKTIWIYENKPWIGLGFGLNLN